MPANKNAEQCGHAQSRRLAPREPRKQGNSQSPFLDFYTYHDHLSRVVTSGCASKSSHWNLHGTIAALSPSPTPAVPQPATSSPPLLPTPDSPQQGCDQRVSQQILLFVPHHDHERVVVLQHRRVGRVRLRRRQQVVVLVIHAPCSQSIDSSIIQSIH